MIPDKIIIKFEQVAEQAHGSVRRIIGFVLAKHSLSLFDAADLEANPRSAKTGMVTDEIMDSIESNPVIFPFKSKGILLGASQYEPLQRSRYELRFVDPKIEGVLDGGHNMLAIGTAILSNVIDDEKELNKIRMWPDLKEAWDEYRDEIEDIKDDLDFLIPIEILVPADTSDEETIDEFRSVLIEICAARNNNVELTRETMANKKGLYNEIRKALPKHVEGRIEWKANDGGGIKVRDILALAWIPLSKLSLPDNIRVPAQNIYRNKGECTRAFDELMTRPEVSQRADDQTYKLKNPAIASAIKILGDLPALYDKIYADFPEAYNSSGGSFGRINVVKMHDSNKRDEGNLKYIKTEPRTHFSDEPVRYRYPDGMIMPLVYGLGALMEVKGGQVRWKVDPERFLDEHLTSIAGAYKLVLEMSQFDPQKIGKNETSYKIAASEFEKALLKRNMAA